MRSAEKAMIRNFKKCLGVKVKTGIQRKENGDVSYRVQIGDVQFYDWLMRIGLFPTKSRTIGPIMVPDEFFADYFRGCFDGDGSIAAYLDRYNIYKGRRYSAERLYIRIFSASRGYIEWLKAKAEAILGAKSAIMCRIPKDNRYASLWILKFSQKSSLRLIEWMYRDPAAPALPRKRRIAENAARRIARRKRRKRKTIRSAPIK